jgi:glycosyltransferase involved in cell wall biosynthesis
MPKVSVIIATHNRSAVLPRAVESAVRAGTDLEIIIVDDASTDETPQVCECWADVSSIRYLRARHRLGVGGARNVGLIASRAPFISFLDDDDIRLPGSLDAQIELLEKQSKAGMIYGRALYGDQHCRPNGNYYPEQCPQGDLFWPLLSWNFIPCPTVVFRRACLTRVGLMEERAPGVEDWDLWVRIAELFPVIAVEQAVAVWRQPSAASGQFTSRGERLYLEARRLHSQKWLQLPRVVEAGDTRRRKATRAFADYAAQQLVWQAAETVKARQLADFVRVTLAGARMCPFGMGKKILSASTWVSLTNGVQNWQRRERRSV